MLGLGDGCGLCEVSPRLWSDVPYILENFPFPVTRDFQSYKEIESQLQVNANGDYVRKGGRADFETRKGASRPPQGVRMTNSFGLTHKVNIYPSFLCLVCVP